MDNLKSTIKNMVTSNNFDINVINKYLTATCHCQCNYIITEIGPYYETKYDSDYYLVSVANLEPTLTQYFKSQYPNLSPKYNNMMLINDGHALIKYTK